MIAGARGNMARPAKVEFPGQKQKVRLRGTKHANEATAKNEEGFN